MLTFAHSEALHTSQTSRVEHFFSQPFVLWLLVIIVPVVIYVACRYLIKLKSLTALLLVGLSLIIFSFATYQTPGIYTAFSLTIGFGLTLLIAVISLSRGA